MASIEEKQEFLRQSILKAGYDPMAFKQFLDSKRSQGGEDLGLWTFDDLKAAVDEFRAEQDKGLSSRALPAQSEAPSAWEFEECKKCIEYSNKVLANSKFKIAISSFERREGSGLFAATHIVYRVQSQGLGFAVWRRYNDFLWLRETLARLYPAHIIPPLPPKGAVRSFQVQFIRMRMRKLELFLQQLANQPDFVNDILLAFLKEEGQSLAKFQAETPASPSATKFEGFRSRDGKARLEMSDRSTAFIKRSEAMFVRQNDLLQRLKECSQNIAKGLSGVAEEAAMASKLFIQLRNSTKTFNEQSRSSEKNEILEEVYAGISNHMVDFCSRVREEHHLVRNYLASFLQNQSDLHREIIKVTEAHAREFARLDKSNERLRKMREGKERASTVEERARQMGEEKQRFAYINATVRGQLEAVRMRVAGLYCENFSEMAKKEIHAISRKQIELLDLQIGYSELLQGKKVVSIKESLREEWVEGGGGFEL